MLKPRTILIALSAVLAGAALSGLGIAQADDPTATTPATIVVNGTDTITLDPSASDATQQATYQTALGGALTDANQKASFIAGQVSATLGAITNVTETAISAKARSSTPRPPRSQPSRPPLRANTRQPQFVSYRSASVPSARSKPTSPSLTT
jgi:uncharacterized protein YggE